MLMRRWYPRFLIRKGLEIVGLELLHILLQLLNVDWPSRRNIIILNGLRILFCFIVKDTVRGLLIVVQLLVLVRISSLK